MRFVLLSQSEMKKRISCDFTVIKFFLRHGGKDSSWYLQESLTTRFLVSLRDSDEREALYCERWKIED